MSDKNFQGDTPAQTFHRLLQVYQNRVYDAVGNLVKFAAENLEMFDEENRLLPDFLPNEINARLSVLGGTAAELDAMDPPPAKREILVEEDTTGKPVALRVGDGERAGGHRISTGGYTNAEANAKFDATATGQQVLFAVPAGYSARIAMLEITTVAVDTANDPPELEVSLGTAAVPEAYLERFVVQSNTVGSRHVEEFASDLIPAETEIALTIHTASNSTGHTVDAGIYIAITPDPEEE